MGSGTLPHTYYLLVTVGVAAEDYANVRAVVIRRGNKLQVGVGGPGVESTFQLLAKKKIIISRSSQILRLLIWPDNRLY